MIIGLVGMTATGKTEIAKALNNYGISKVVTTTTRPMRPGEKAGIDYDFVSDEKFQKMVSNKEFAETTSYETVHGVWKYGTPINKLINSDTHVIILNPDGLKSLKDMPQLNMTVFHIQASEGTIRNRLRFRGDSQDEAERRIRADKKDFKNIESLVDFSIRNEGDMTPNMIAHIIFEISKIIKEEMSNG